MFAVVFADIELAPVVLYGDPDLRIREVEEELMSAIVDDGILGDRGREAGVVDSESQPRLARPGSTRVDDQGERASLHDSG